MREVRQSLLACALLTAMPHDGHADGRQPLGAQFQVNTYTTGYQGAPNVATAPDGSVLVVWGSNGSIRGRIGAPDGAVGAPDFQINGPVPGTLDTPGVAAIAEDAFVVAYRWHDRSYYRGTIGARGVSSSGAPIGDDFEVATPEYMQYLGAPSVAKRGDDGFVVVWTDGGYSPSSSRIRARLYDVDGVAEGDVIDVDVDPLGQVGLTLVSAAPAVARPDSGGDFVVASAEASCSFAGCSDHVLLARAFDADGNDPPPPELLANDVGDVTIVAPPDGGFRVVWSDLTQDGRRIVTGRDLNDEGVPDSPVVEISDLPYRIQIHRSAAVANDGTMLVVGVGGPDWPTRTHVSAFGVAPGDAGSGRVFQVNSYTGGSPYHPSVAALPGGYFMVVWQATVSLGSDTDGASIQGRIVRPPGTTWLWFDGFESGTPDAWTAVAG